MSFISSAASGGIAQVTTATTATTLTSTPTLLQITPASYGVTVTLPNASICPVGGPLHCIDNRGAYPVRVVNTSGTLLGFIYGGVVSYISLDNKSTAAGVWAISNNELAGASAQLLTTNMAAIDACIDIGSSQEVIIGRGKSNANCYGVVYNRATNTFGAVTLIRTATFGNDLIAACLSAANQVLVTSVATGATTFEAVTLSISGTTITVNTAATATLSANISAFADGCGLIAVGSSLVTSYRVATPAAEIRALSISGTAVTIGSASVLSGTAGGLIAASANHVIAVSTATTTLTTTPYLVSGSTLTTGTGTTTTSGTMTLDKLAALGTRWYVGYNDGGSTVRGGVVSINTTGNGTTTISLATLMAAGAITDAIVVSSSKVLVLNNQTSNNANLLTDTAGTASAGTAITLTTQTERSAVYVSGTNVIVNDGSSTQLIVSVDCSGASPVFISRQQTSAAAQYASSFRTSNAVLSRSAYGVYGSAFAQETTANTNPTSTSQSLVVRGDVALTRISQMPKINGLNYRGKTASENWMVDTLTVIQKRECIP